ncbi:MAG: leucyl aminopeptidase [Gemmatimonadetes bacterium]|nr:leucyl aminopeptidase [Gemmatimonadota bacterium]MCY3943409.1 leucyl aminopeptidase [Gemmatimonadota bacterium]
MQLELAHAPPERVETPLMVALVAADRPFEDLRDLDAASGRTLSLAAASGDFRGRSGECLLGYAADGKGPRRVLFLGVGDAASAAPEELRSAAGRAVREAERCRVTSLALCADHLSDSVDEAAVHSLAEGLALASWRYDELRSRGAAEGGGALEDPPPPMVESVLIAGRRASGWEGALARGRLFADAENWARTLQARPGNVATPSHLAAEARRMADEVGLECNVLGPEELEEEGMGALLAVSRGSREEPRLIVLRHRGGKSGEAPLVLVGKGLTFDAGGISLKPAKGMEKMKYDMSGGAAVLGAMLAVGRLGLEANVAAVVPCAENLPGGMATKPGDVVRTRAGKSVEVVNTDAEGRLILADALDYAKGWRPAAVVDCATLTGACVVALGHHRSALLGSDGELAREILAAGERSGERCWWLPMGAEYRKQLDSECADLKNVGGRAAGTITAACFLAEFAGDAPWAHLDIAGTAYGSSDRPYLRDGPTGAPCRLLLEWLWARAGR